MQKARAARSARTCRATAGCDTLAPMLRLTFPLLLACSLAAQTKLPPAPADYGQWETLVDFGGGGGRGGGGGANTGGFSPDGKWIAYGINRSNGNNELRVSNIASGSVKTTAFGSQA